MSKKILTHAPVLKIVELDKDFVVCTNAYNIGLGLAFMQEGYVICYASSKLKDHERNYSTYDLELAMIVHALRMWRHYLLGKKFELRIYHLSLKHLFDQSMVNAQ